MSRKRKFPSPEFIPGIFSVFYKYETKNENYLANDFIFAGSVDKG